MIKITKNYKNAIIILHEIYGVNRFIETISLEYHIQGFDVYCPDMLQNKLFYILSLQKLIIILFMKWALKFIRKFLTLLIY